MKNSSGLVRLAYAYIVLPVFIFITGWCNWPTAVIGGLILAVSFYFMCKNAPKLWVPATDSEKRLLVLVFLVGAVWVYLSGIGALVFQNTDHNCRNPIFEILVQAPWPVHLAEPPAVMTYYIGFWLPPALVGKVFHSVQLGYYAQVVWAAIGVFLFFYLLLASLKRKTYWPVFLFILFSGLDVVGCLAQGFFSLAKNPLSHMEWWYPYFQFSGFTTQLFWVFNQALPAWVGVMLLYHEKNNKNMAFVYACLFLNCTLPAIGLFPFMLYWYAKNGHMYTWAKTALCHLKETVLSSFTFQNLAGALCVVVISFTYLSRNAAGAATSSNPVSIPPVNLLNWFVLFFMLEAGIYLLFVWKSNRKNVLFYLCSACLLIYPFIKVGHGPDFCMRGTIPALVVLFVMIVKTLQNTYWRRKNRVLFYSLLAVLALGAVTPVHELTRTIYMTRLGYTKIAPDLSFDNFFGLTEGNLFWKYFAKHTKN